MLIYIALLIVGIVLLAWSAERFIAGAVGMAHHFRIAPLIIGLTIVALGTSAPEIFISIMSVTQGNPGLAIGNALGSNIANIGLVLGVAALCRPMQVHSTTLRREYPILFLIMLITWGLLLDGSLDPIDGIILLICLIGFFIWLVWLATRKVTPQDPLRQEFERELQHTLPIKSAIAFFILGLILLPISSHILVFSAVNIASQLGVSDVVIGLTIVAIGTSLPEMAASLIGSLKGEHDLAIGNILGSNMFNLLAVLAIPGLLQSVPLASSVLSRDMPIMFGLTIVLFLVAYGFRGPGCINRWEGALLLTCYGAYLTWIVIAAIH
ncbi:MAG: calcium/sodium antiporter [Legionellales bacterium]|nr:calcium/sodium antiporter [Legionellales bacterium]